MFSDRLIGKYGFTNRVIDGISLNITSLTFAIKAQHFKASVFVSNHSFALILLEFVCT